MEVKKVVEYLEKDTRIILKDGKTFEGFLSNTVSEFDTSSGKDEVELITGLYEVGIPIDEIDSISLL